MIDPEMIAEGRRMDAAATPPPWRIEYDSDGDEYNDYGTWPYALKGPRRADGRKGAVTEIGDLTDADAELIPLMRNTFAGLLAAAKTLERVREALADHPRCEKHPDDDEVKCGWKRAVLDIQRALES